jgi:hypothetical protein
MYVMSILVDLLSFVNATNGCLLVKTAKYHYGYLAVFTQ